VAADDPRAAREPEDNRAESPDGLRRGRAARAANALALAGLTVYAMAAPHSIAGAWIGLSFAVLGWLARGALTRRLGLRRTPFDLPLWLLCGWTILSCLFSYEPTASIPKLVNVATFLVFYLAQGLLTVRRAITLSALMIVSGATGVLWGAVELVRGRGVIVRSLAPDSPLRGATPLTEGDAVWRVNGRRVSSAEEIDEAVRATPLGARLSLSVVSRGEHAEWSGPFVTEEIRGRASPTGIEGGGPTRRFRASGWTRHYETFAETIQIAAQLALGFALAFGRRRARRVRTEGETKTSGAAETNSPETKGRDVEGGGDRLRLVLAAIACMVLVSGVALTAMRTAVVAFAVGATLAAWRAATGGRARLLLIGLIAVALGLGALAVWRTRAGGALRLQDTSASLRFQVARAAAERVPQHPFLGHGMDAAPRHWREWGFPGDTPLHMHSTPVQLAFERGLPALFFWLWLMLTFWREAARAERFWRDRSSAAMHGLVLGIAGALAGFLASSLVNYNFGDAEVALLLWWMMAATVVCSERGASNDERRALSDES
jgi:hypothetical protein